MKADKDVGLVSDAEWELWHQDNFDLESPRLVEKSGQGLAEGLKELWARHLGETVQADGSTGFSRFNLWWKQRGCSIQIMGDMQGQLNLRKWVFGNRQPHQKGCVAAADQNLLGLIAKTHCGLLLKEKSVEDILYAAAVSKKVDDFKKRFEMN